MQESKAVLSYTTRLSPKDETVTTETSEAVRAACRARRWALIVPREHGAWGLLLVPLFTGVAAGMALAPRLWPLLAFTIAALSLFWLRKPIESLTGTSPLTAHTSQEWWTAFLASISLSGISVACLTGLMWKGRNLELLLFGTVAGVAFVGVLSPIGTAQREEPRMVRDAARSDVRDSAGDCFHLVLRNGQSLYILRQWTSTPEGEWELVSFRQAG